MIILLLFSLMVIAAIASFFFKKHTFEYALGVSAAVLVVIVFYTVLRFHSGYTGGYISTFTYGLASKIGIFFSIGVSSFSDALLLLSAIVIFVAVAITRKKDYVPSIYSFMILIEIGLFGILISRDFLFFYIFWEVVLIPAYFIVAEFGGKNKDHVSLKFFVYTHIGSVFLLLAIFTVYSFYYIHTGIFTFQISSLMSVKYFAMIPTTLKYFAIFGFLFSFLVKLPSFPIHSWLPDTYETAPYPGTVILAGGLSIMGGYGLFGILLPVGSLLGNTVLYILIGLGIISLIYFALSAMMQYSLKRMMAFASAAAMGFVTLSFGAGILETGIEQPLELAGGMYQILAHGLIMTLIFAALYFINQKAGSDNIYSLGGIFREMPVLSSSLLVGLLASLGLPGFAGFIGEFSVLVGSFQAIGWVIILVIFAMIITASYHIWAAQRSLYGPYNEHLGAIKDVSAAQFSILLFMMIAIFIFGIVPNLYYGSFLAYLGALI